MTLAAVEQCSEAVARALTSHLRQVTVDLGLQYQLWEGLVIEAYQREAWRALGYDSWRAYVATEVPQLQDLRFGRDERRELVVSFREAGMSTRAIGAALGVGIGTVHRDQAASGVPDGTPDEPVDAEIVDESPDDLADHLAQSDADYHRQAADMEAQLRAEREQAHTPDPEPVRITGTDGKTYSAQPKPRRTPEPPLTGDRLDRYDGEKRSAALANACTTLTALAYPMPRAQFIDAWRDYPEGASPAQRENVGPAQFRGYADALRTFADEWEAINA